APASDTHGPARVPRCQLPLGLLHVNVVIQRVGRHHHLHDTPPAAPRGRGPRCVCAPPARAARHAGLHLPLLRVPLRALAPAPAASSLARALAVVARGPRGRGGHRRRGVHLRAKRAWARALGRVSVPVAPRKYELVQGLAERLLDGNNVAAVTHVALAGAFERMLRQLEASVGGEWGSLGMELAVRAVRSVVRWWRPTVATLEGDAFGGPAAEKLAAELLWLGQKMDECGTA
ncbi:hypothetical protein CFC21_014230, partial [Triticum aestivum]